MLSYNTPAPVNGQLNGHLNGQLNGSSSANAIANMAPPVRPLGNNPKPIPVSAGPVAPNNTITKIYGHASPKYHHIWLVTGPAGCGKTTVAKYLSTNLKVPYVEGDDVGLLLPSILLSLFLPAQIITLFALFLVSQRPFHYPC